ncbi:MAG: hypothetical protein HY237_02040 [Acidobacteria bacterium]|nr:hypothetical protein [Acidobacteriota bacterium]
MTFIPCDGCGLPASPEHIARRLRRLELATRFRPIHIDILFLARWPPPRLEDYFYFLDEGSNQGAFSQAGPARFLFDSLLQALGIREAAEKGDEACLTDFQRRGFYLAECVECPLEEATPAFSGSAATEGARLAERFGPTMVKRIKFSYRPKHVALLGTLTQNLIPVLQQAGLADCLMLYQGMPLELPRLGDAAAAAEFRTALGELVAAAASRAKSA